MLVRLYRQWCLQGKVRSLTDKFFPEDEDDNVMLNFLKKISRKEEVSLQASYSERINMQL